MKKATVFLILIILGGVSVAQNRTGATPSAGSPKQFVLPAIKTFRLDNGLSVSLVPYGIIPKVTISLVVRAGNLNEAEDEIWLADLTGNLLKEGTTSRTSQAIADEAASMGGNLYVSAGMENTSISGDVLSEFAPGMVELIADVAMNPKFPSSEVERLKNDMLRDLSIQKTQPSNIAFELFSRILYPEHPYGRIFPEQAMIEGYDAGKAKDFYSKNFGALRSHLFIVGVFDEPTVEEKIREVFSGWAGGPEPLVNIPSPVIKGGVYFYDRPGTPQAVLNIGIPVVDPSNKDYLALVLTNNLLGGAFTSRITMNIREQKGYTYSPYSRVQSRFRSAFWLQFAEVGTDVTAPAVKEIFNEIDRLTNDSISREELEGIKNFTNGTFMLTVSTRQGIISQLTFLNLHGLDISYLQDYTSKINAITADDVKYIMKTYFRPSDMAIVIAGDKEKTGGAVSALIKGRK